MTSPDTYRPTASVWTDPKLHLMYIGFQGSFMQAASGREFTPDEAARLGSIVAIKYTQIELRRRALESMYSNGGDPNYNHARMVWDTVSHALDGDYRQLMSFFNGYSYLSLLANGTMSETDKTRKLNDGFQSFNKRIPISGRPLRQLLEERGDTNILADLENLNSRLIPLILLP